MLTSRMDDAKYEPLEIIGGAKTRGVIQRASDMETPPLDFSAPRLICRVTHNSLLQTGQVVRRRGGQHYIVADCSSTPDYRTHWLIVATRLAVLKKPVSTTDALTNKTKQSGFDSGNPIWVAWEAVTREAFDRDMRVREELSRVITGAGVDFGDLIDDQMVKRIQPVLGVNLITVQ